LTLLFLSVLGAGVVMFVLFPIFARAAEVAEPPSTGALERQNLTDKKEQIYEAIKDLDFERQAGKLSEGDHRALRADFLSQAAKAMARIDEIEHMEELHKRSQAAPVIDDTKGSVTEAVPRSSCPSCHETNPPGAEFCFRCGTKIPTSVECPHCGTELPEEARFCISCGAAIPA
jgi:ribosomal protein L40E